MSPSPQLEYPSDFDLPDYPARPRFRPTMLGLIPSPSMSILELNEDEQPSILDQLPEVGRLPPQTSVPLSPMGMLTFSPEIRRSRVVPQPATSRAPFQRGYPVR